MQKRTLSNFVPLILFALFFLGMAAIQFASPDLPDNDGFYHIKLAWLMRTEGLKPQFPWLPLSILNQREFYDHHFLFHVALIPFTFGDLRLGAKWAAVTFASLAFLAVWYLFYRQRVPLAWLWALGLLGVSDAFLYRMSIPRAQSLSLAVMALGLTWMLEGKYRRLAVLAFFYVWMYDAFPLLLALAVLHLLAGALIEQKEMQYLAQNRNNEPKKRLFWTMNEARDEYRGAGRTVENDFALYNAKRNGEYWDIYLGTHSIKRQSFLTLTAAQDYCETRFEYLNKHEDFSRKQTKKGRLEWIAIR